MDAVPTASKSGHSRFHLLYLVTLPNDASQPSMPRSNLFMHLIYVGCHRSNKTIKIKKINIPTEDPQEKRKKKINVPYKEASRQNNKLPVLSMSHVLVSLSTEVNSRNYPLLNKFDHAICSVKKSTDDRPQI